MSQSTRERRSEARPSWPIRKYRLGEEPSEDLSATTTVEERLGMMWRLARDAWAVSGRPIPDYPREKTPISKRRLHDPPADWVGISYPDRCRSINASTS